MTSARAATTREEGAIHVTASARSGSLIDARELPADVVTLDSRVRLVDLDSGEVLLFTVVLPSRANADEGRISVLAPLGMAVLGYRTQDVIEWDVPAGRRRLGVQRVVYQPEAANRLRIHEAATADRGR